MRGPALHGLSASADGDPTPLLALRAPSATNEMTLAVGSSLPIKRTAPSATARSSFPNPSPLTPSTSMMRLAIFIGVVILVAGCGLLPEVSKQPTIHNPFPQLTKVAVAPFINLSTDPSVDGREFGLAYFTELQSIPGFEVVPIGVVETAMRDNHLTLSSAADCRRLAQLLGR